MARHHMTDDGGLFTATVSDPALDGLPTSAFWHLLGREMWHDRLIRVLEPPVRPGEYQGETPFEGTGAVARWVALHDRARDLRTALRPRDIVGERQVRRAIHSLFLYEHQLTPKTRRQARTALWRRDRANQSLPPFVERVGWSKCSCPRCKSRGGAPRPVREGIVLQSA